MLYSLYKIEEYILLTISERKKGKLEYSRSIDKGRKVTAAEWEQCTKQPRHESTGDLLSLSASADDSLRAVMDEFYSLARQERKWYREREKERETLANLTTPQLLPLRRLFWENNWSCNIGRNSLVYTSYCARVCKFFRLHTLLGNLTTFFVETSYCFSLMGINDCMLNW